MSGGWAALATVATRQTAPAVSEFPTISEALAARAQVAGPREALILPTVWACVRTIAHTVEQLPLRHTVGSDPRPLPEWLRVPERDSTFTTGQLLELFTTDMATHGAAYAWWDAPTVRGRARLTPVDVDTVMVAVTRDRGRILRSYRVHGEPVELATPDRSGLVHMPYLTTSHNVAGMGPLANARESLAGMLTVERYAAQLFERGDHAGGRLETEQELAPATAERYADRWVKARRQADRIPVLGHGLAYRHDTINARDAQWLESRTFNAQEVARMFGVPPRYLGLPSGDATVYATARDNDATFLRSCISSYTSSISGGLSRLVGTGRSESDAGRITFDFSDWLAVVSALENSPTAPIVEGVTP